MEGVCGADPPVNGRCAIGRLPPPPVKCCGGGCASGAGSPAGTLLLPPVGWKNGDEGA
jgi:hypothetical protein